MNNAGTKKKIVCACAAVFLFALLLTFAAYAGNMLVVDNPQPADVIVVLAGETDRRPARGLELLVQGRAPRMLLDVPSAAKIYNFTQVDLAEKYTQGLPHSESIRVCPIEGLSTRDESHNVERCLAGEPGNRILIVTSEFHTRRALSIFRHEISGKSFSVAASYNDTQFGTRWWTHREWSKTCFDEWIRLFWWNAVDRWR
jgi:uncharacterized SAM-binding protein YcdF (DUF218 family)